MDEPAIKVLKVLERTRKRRIKDPEKVPSSWHWVNWSSKDLGFGHTMLIWIDEFTTGQFYFDTRFIAFEKGEDAFIYEMGFGNPEKHNKKRKQW